VFEAARTAICGAERPRVMARIKAPLGVWLAAALVLLVAALGGREAAAQTISAEILVDTSGGYARIVYRFNGDVDANVRMSNGILLMSFSVPVELSTDRLTSAAAGYLSAARRDPDGKGLRIALARKLSLHSMQANDRLFVDLLPDGWTGPPPPLPQDVVEELARRAKEAERRDRQMRLLAQQKQMVVTRVRVAHQPTFSRYVFELPELVSVIAERSGGKLNLQLDAPLKFDVDEAKASLPPMIERIDTETGEQNTTIKFTLVGKVDIRSFREDNSYVVDVAPYTSPNKRSEAAGPRLAEASRAGEGALSGLEVPRSIPVNATENAKESTRGTGSDTDTDSAKDSLSDAAAETKQPRTVQSPPAARVAPLPGALAPGAPPHSMAFNPVKQIDDANRAGMRPLTPVADNLPRGEAAAPPPQETPRQETSHQEMSGQKPLPAPRQELPSPQPPAKGANDSASSDVRASRAKIKASAPVTVVEADNRIADPGSTGKVRLQRQSDNLKLVFPFVAATSGAVFSRADAVWVVIDSPQDIDVDALKTDPTRTIKDVTVESTPDFQVVRIVLERPRLTSFSAAETDWTITIGDAVIEPTQPLAVTRSLVGTTRPSAVAAFERPQAIRRIADPDVGDTLFVVTGFAPARGLIKEQHFIEFRLLASTHGVVVQPYADDVDVELSGDKVLISRPAGLILSPANQVGRRGYRPVVLDAQAWGFDREAGFDERQKTLINAAAAAPEGKRLPPRFEIARFYLAREMYPEAKGVLDVALAEDHPTAEDSTGLVMRAIAQIMMGRVEEGLQDLASPLVGDNYDAQLWRALAYAKQGRWSEAADNFKKMETAITTLPAEFQRQVMLEAVRASIETRDFAAASEKLDEFEALGVPKELEPRIAVLSGRLAEGLGHNEEALEAYRSAAESSDRVSAARGRLLDIALRFRLGETKQGDVISELETLTTFWRGDDTEIEALQLLARLYTVEGRYREAFHVMRTAFKAHPNSESTRRIQDEAATTFESLFLAGKGNAMPAVEALALFYDFRELIPIGRRGDEMIRRLSDRLVSVDLLDQAAELLQHQVDHRLQGAARSEVAARLAVIYLMNRKPDMALAVLRSTRTADVANELRNQRLLVEARALSDIGRHDTAIDIISNMSGHEAIRMRADAFWAAKRWREAAEQIELLYGDRWKEFDSLNDFERADLLRAALGYSLADDALGAGRFREKYAAKMADGPNRRAFEVASSPFAASSAEFRVLVRQIAAVDTLDGFLRELRSRYPVTGAFGAPATTPGSPASPASRRLSAISPPGPGAELRPSPSDRMPTGSDEESASSVAAQPIRTDSR
jgi:tetratricopeptide (TPR) repeat protein